MSELEVIMLAIAILEVLNSLWKVELLNKMGGKRCWDRGVCLGRLMVLFGRRVGHQKGRRTQALLILLKSLYSWNV